jgi:uncharacterized protein (TIGR03089 family)
VNAPVPRSPSTFPAALAGLLRTAPSRPLVTFYDDATGERVELSVATYANWVAKTAGLAQDELDLTRGDLVLVDLPAHWLTAVWLGAAWTLGMVVTDDRTQVQRADLVVCGPERVASYAVEAASPERVCALSLRPLGGRFAEPLPAGVLDAGAVVLAQPDVFMADDPPQPDDEAWRDVDGSLTQRQLMTGPGGFPVTAQGRLLTDVGPATRAGLGTLLGPVALDAGVVWVRHPDPVRWADRGDQERTTAELLAQA